MRCLNCNANLKYKRDIVKSKCHSCGRKLTMKESFSLFKLKTELITKFSEFLDDFFTMESIEWNNINKLKSDEIHVILNFYERFRAKLEGMYPISREESFRSTTGLPYERLRYHHLLVPFHTILDDRLVFFKSVLKAIESWDNKQFSNALKEYKLINDFFMEFSDIIPRIDQNPGPYRLWQTLPAFPDAFSDVEKRWGMKLEGKRLGILLGQKNPYFKRSVKRYSNMHMTNWLIYNRG
ncbi:hypothetical protein LCGC14_2678440, partial [marine sediment metagenome]